MGWNTSTGARRTQQSYYAIRLAEKQNMFLKKIQYLESIKLKEEPAQTTQAQKDPQKGFHESLIKLSSEAMFKKKKRRVWQWVLWQFTLFLFYCFLLANCAPFIAIQAKVQGIVSKPWHKEAHWTTSSLF